MKGELGTHGYGKCQVLTIRGGTLVLGQALAHRGEVKVTIERHPDCDTALIDKMMDEADSVASKQPR